MKQLTLAALALTLFSTLGAHAQEALIRKNLPARVPQLSSIDEIKKSPIPGLYEVRINGTDIFYTDAKADYLVHGSLIETQSMRNLTEERVEKLSAISFNTLPLKDAFTIVRGNGKRKLAVFEDPNCGYCKQFEASLQKIDNVTIYMFLYPVLGPGSVERSKNIWCAADKAKSWQDWMLKNIEPTAAKKTKGWPDWMSKNDEPTDAKCDSSAIERNTEFGRKHKITGTPTLIFPDGTRIPGAIGADQVEKRL